MLADLDICNIRMLIEHIYSKQNIWDINMLTEPIFRIYITHRFLEWGKKG